MDAGITFARSYKLRPGIALSAQQMAQLTSDIVWLVEQTVTLADGTSGKALVPQVYVRVQAGDLDGTGALLAGKTVDIRLSGDLVNSATIAGGAPSVPSGGTVAGRKLVSLTAQNVQNLGGRITGDVLNIAARQDLNNVGGTIAAASALSASAGRDLNVITTTSSGTSRTGQSSFSRTGPRASEGPLCISVDASQRLCNYAMTVDVALDRISTVPEPDSPALFGQAGLALLCHRRVRFPGTQRLS